MFFSPREVVLRRVVQKKRLRASLDVGGGGPTAEVWSRVELTSGVEIEIEEAQPVLPATR
jgi:hypothetical protein